MKSKISFSISAWALKVPGSGADLRKINDSRNAHDPCNPSPSFYLLTGDRLILHGSLARATAIDLYTLSGRPIGRKLAVI